MRSLYTITGWLVIVLGAIYAIGYVIYWADGHLLFGSSVAAFILIFTVFPGLYLLHVDKNGTNKQKLLDASRVFILIAGTGFVLTNAIHFIDCPMFHCGGWRSVDYMLAYAGETVVYAIGGILLLIHMFLNKYDIFR